jgi:hypothetical protein
MTRGPKGEVTQPGETGMIKGGRETVAIADAASAGVVRIPSVTPRNVAVRRDSASTSIKYWKTARNFDTARLEEE